MRVWRWIRHRVSQWDDPLRALVVCGWVLYVDYLPRDLPDEAPRRHGTEPPPGHPERLTRGQPLSPAERELWAALGGIDW